MFLILPCSQDTVSAALLPLGEGARITSLPLVASLLKLQVFDLAARAETVRKKREKTAAKVMQNGRRSMLTSACRASVIQNMHTDLL